jgi:hypothetical protein
MFMSLSARLAGALYTARVPYQWFTASTAALSALLHAVLAVQHVLAELQSSHQWPGSGCSVLLRLIDPAQGCSNLLCFVAAVRAVRQFERVHLGKPCNVLLLSTSTWLCITHQETAN